MLSIIYWVILHENNMADAFIIGCGDIGQRTAKLWMAQHDRVGALVRSMERARPLGHLGITLIQGDLDEGASLAHLPLKNTLLFYFAPPPNHGTTDPRLRNMLTAITPENRPTKIVYISTSGVYGDCQGAWVTEDTPTHPRSERGARRLDAEMALQDWQRSTGVPVIILRVPGIYGPGRLPIDRIKQGLPVVREEEAPYSNRIHADDLARICIAAAHGGAGRMPAASAADGHPITAEDKIPAGTRVQNHQPNTITQIYNVSDGNPSSMTDYFNKTADLLNLPRPPAVSMAEARARLTPGMLSFLEESRRIDNRKMHAELGVTLLYPTLDAGLPACH